MPPAPTRTPLVPTPDGARPGVLAPVLAAAYHTGVDLPEEPSVRIAFAIGITIAAATTPVAASAQTAADSAALVATAKDYIQGWYAGDAARMARSLHPELVKRIHGYDSVSNRYQVDGMGASRLVLGTARGGGTRTPKERQRSDVRILDIFRGTAVVRVDADAWVDYLQLVREGDRWLILNVLWELRNS